MQLTKSEAIKAFLTHVAPADLAGLYNLSMEVQVNVAKDQGERVQGDYKGKLWLGYTDGIQTWKPIRIPMFANTVPEYNDTPMSYDLAAHAEGIGMTGWDWQNKLSRWVAFDFDAIVGHSEKHTRKLSDLELEEIIKCLQNIPCVTIRKSTGGKGLHLYVFLEPTSTANHNEHAAVARAILSQLSGLAGFDFGSKVDICGGNMWVWHRKMAGTDGLQVIKQGTELACIPPNWRDYTKVVSGRRSRNLPRFIEEQASARTDIEDVFAELTGQRLRVKPDEEHKKLMNWLFDNYGSATWWDAENHMLVTHTYLLKLAHEALCLKGRFETNAAGTEKGFDHNCYMFPMSKGAWAVRRFSIGVQEHVFWEQDGQQWTRCFYNQELTLPTAARIYNGLEDTKGGFHFTNAEDAQNAAMLLGADLSLPNRLLTRKAKVFLDKQGRLVVEVSREIATDHPIDGWISEAKKFQKIFTIRKATLIESEVQQYDDVIRHIVTEAGDDWGWCNRSEGNWLNEPFQHIKTMLSGMGHKPQDVAAVMSANIRKPWTLVNRPFKEEYPKDRQWNRGAAQLRYKPSLDRESLSFPTWLKILDHCGQGLDVAVRDNEWCRASGIMKGSDWLKCWIASLFQEPTEPLPYLFFYSHEQNTGKTIFHEALALLITSGVARADMALTSTAAFNGELEHAVLCVVEETDLRNRVAYNRIKDWVTSRMLPIHKKGKQPYSILNTTHWVQCANNPAFCPVFQNDTRITMVQVPELGKNEMIPRRAMIPLLEKEAPDFLADILALELPISNDRLNVPCLVTGDKLKAEMDNQSDLDFFLAEHCSYAPGWAIKYEELWNLFSEKLDANQVSKWTKQKMGKELPPMFVKGKHKSSGQYWIGNIAAGKIPAEKHGNKISLDDKMYLYLKDELRYYSENPK